MEKSKRCYIDTHVLQTVPPSCVNRDDTGSPKTATYGGVTRARVSSQAWKRAIRLAFRDIFKEDQVGERSKLFVSKMAEVILELKHDTSVKDAEKLAAQALKDAGISVKDDNSMDTLLFMSQAQMQALAELAVSGEKNKDEYKKAIKTHPALDMALFGRMIAGDASLNYDAAAQVAHAISTHAVQNEFDYFTAVDDLAPEDNTGAGHIGTVEFNSATLYRYATVNVGELIDLIPEYTTEAVKGFVEAFCKSMPTGKQNTFANGTVPDMIYVAIRGDQPVNLAGAFEKPVKTKDGGYAAASERALVSYAKDTYDLFVAEPELALGCSRRNGLEEIAEMITLPQIIERIGDAVSEYVALKAVKQ